MEIKEYGEWKPFTLPVWEWGIVLVVALFPALNMMALFIFIVLCVVDSRSYWATTRFKENNVINNFINKILNLLTKEF
jgi:TM2 domain-containing membrane protein YozV